MQKMAWMRLAQSEFILWSAFYANYKQKETSAQHKCALVVFGGATQI